MSYMNAMRETEDILSLVESIDANHKKGIMEGITDVAPDNDPFGTVSLDDINDTVETNDGAIEPENNIGDVELSEQEKTIVRQHLKEMLDEIKGDDISEPALEMIIQEVAQNSAFLTEADEDKYGSPVEKTQLLKAKVDAISTYAKGLLGAASDNGGEIPESEEGAPVEPEATPEGGDVPEVAPETPVEEKKEEEVSEAVAPVVEGEVPVAPEAPVDEAKPVDEGVCTECGDEPVDVPEEDVIKVVDDSEVEPIDGLGAESAPVEGEYATKNDIAELKQLILSLGSQTTAVLESAGLIQGTDPITNLEGGNPSSLGKPTHSSQQKKITPSYSQPGFKVAELKDLASKPAKTSAGAPFTKENASEVASAQPAFNKEGHDKGKSNSAPDGGIPSTPSAPKKPSAGVTNPTDPQKAAVLRESATNKAKSWLEEARSIIKNGK